MYTKTEPVHFILPREGKISADPMRESNTGQLTQMYILKCIFRFYACVASQ